jgi:hypothetical protein
MILFIIVGIIFLSQKVVTLKIYDKNVVCLLWREYYKSYYDSESGIIITDKKYKILYTLFPIKISTDLGNIHIKPFFPIELDNYGDYIIAIAFKNIVGIDIRPFHNPMKIKYDLEVFRNKIESMYYLEIKENELSMLKVWQNIIIDETNYRILDIKYDRIEKKLFFNEYLWDLYLTLDGEIINKVWTFD